MLFAAFHCIFIITVRKVLGMNTSVSDNNGDHNNNSPLLCGNNGERAATFLILSGR